MAKPKSAVKITAEARNAVREIVSRLTKDNGLLLMDPIEERCMDCRQQTTHVNGRQIEHTPECIVMLAFNVIGGI